MSEYELLSHRKKSSHGGFVAYDHPYPDDTVHRLNERRRAALAEVDEASFSWFHMKVCAVAGVGFFTDSYDIFAISIAATMLGYVYNDRQSSLPPSQDFAIKVATPCGTLVGQLVFGWLADILGRKRMYGNGLSLVGILVVWRVVMGIGIGGDYPLSAIISSEFASTRTRGRIMTAVFACQGWGNFCAGIVGLVIVTAFRGRFASDHSDDLVYVDHMWRWLIGLGCVPAAIALYFRLTIPETPRFTMDVERNVQQAYSDVQSSLATGNYRVSPDAPIYRAKLAHRPNFVSYFSRWENLRVLIGTSYSWFALDISFYGLGLNTATVLSAIGMEGNINSTSAAEVYETLRKACIGQVILSLAGLIPGFWFSFLFIDTWGRKPIQIMGFGALFVIFLIMGCAYDTLTVKSKQVLFALYCFANLFSNFGPNVTTFVMPGELFPTRYRSTAHGISAASGKFGAILAQVIFWKLDPHQETTLGDGEIRSSPAGVRALFIIFSVFMLSGIFSTLLLPETRQRSLEDLSNEDQEGFVQGFVDGGTMSL